MRSLDIRQVAAWISVLFIAAGFWLGLEDRLTSGGLLFAVGCFLLTLSQYAPGPFLKGRF